MHSVLHTSIQKKVAIRAERCRRGAACCDHCVHVQNNFIVLSNPNNTTQDTEDGAIATHELIHHHITHPLIIMSPHLTLLLCITLAASIVRVTIMRLHNTAVQSVTQETQHCILMLLSDCSTTHIPSIRCLRPPSLILPSSLHSHDTCTSAASLSTPAACLSFALARVKDQLLQLHTSPSSHDQPPDIACADQLSAHFRI